MHMDTDAITVVRRRLTVQLPPAALADVKTGLLRYLKRRLGRFDTELDGIVLDYKNVKILNDRGLVKHDSADLQLDIEADFHAFRPEVGVELRGVINKKCVTHLSVLVHKIFNVVIPRPADVTSDWSGDKLNVGDNVLFTIASLDLLGALPYIRGELSENCKVELSDGELASKTSMKVTPARVNFDGTKPRLPCSSDSDTKNDSTKRRKRKSSAVESMITKKKRLDSSSTKSISTGNESSEEIGRRNEMNNTKNDNSVCNGSFDSCLNVSTSQNNSKSETKSSKKRRKDSNIGGSSIDSSNDDLNDSANRTNEKKIKGDKNDVSKAISKSFDNGINNSEKESNNKDVKSSKTSKKKKRVESSSDSSSDNELDISAKQNEILNRFLKLKECR